MSGLKHAMNLNDTTRLIGELCINRNRRTTRVNRGTTPSTSGPHPVIYEGTMNIKHHFYYTKITENLHTYSGNCPPSADVNKNHTTTKELPPSWLSIRGNRMTIDTAVVGVQTAITGHGPTPPEGGTSLHRSGCNSTPHPCYTPRRNKNPLTYPAASNPRTCGALPGERRQ
ncbi:hypothetical protein AVEN_196676-1 [Araneus ventricosus]|uniref:Uncharacterized protein n=1 Tax=Araneus ventricosus TaxID=182803 RepID=A0A4Y2KUI9_ARAVE|nr:hypothetical protein AVEN_196676-1 [Araneus ventricosus]